MKRVVLATNNPGKVEEMRQLLNGVGFDVLPQSHFQLEEIEETGLTFIENAIIKARHACKMTGLPAIADDSGLAVDALGGEPGIYSARYAGGVASDRSVTDHQNILKLLENLLAFPSPSERIARFHCVLVMMRHEMDPTPLVCHGVWEGSIAKALTGEGGFGYDPVFICPEFQCTAASLTSVQKNKLSHRGQALNLLLQQLNRQSDYLSPLDLN